MYKYINIQLLDSVTLCFFLHFKYLPNWSFAIILYYLYQKLNSRRGSLYSIVHTIHNHMIPSTCSVSRGDVMHIYYKYKYINKFMFSYLFIRFCWLFHCAK
uniref:Uncharacterized protein n=1 Tax=Sipha flava TaxID=143950 RepID=A0A2S2QI35_9HEMI